MHQYFANQIVFKLIFQGVTVTPTGYNFIFSDFFENWSRCNGYTIYIIDYMVWNFENFERLEL